MDCAKRRKTYGTKNEKKSDPERVEFHITIDEIYGNKMNDDDLENKSERFEIQVAVGRLRAAQENLRNEKRKTAERKDLKTNDDDSENKPERFEIQVAVGRLRDSAGKNLRSEKRKTAERKDLKTNDDDSENKPERFEIQVAVGGLRAAQENLRKENGKK